MVFGLLFPEVESFQGSLPAFCSLCSTSSVKVFHWAQEGHLPNHLALSWPQLPQKKDVFILDTDIC
jgi:hypothetical protein